MAIRTVVTRGYGNGTFSGTIPLVVTRGYAIGTPPVVAKYTMNVLVNLSPQLNVTSNPTPSKEVDSG
jgi:hypothetical protein